MTNFKLSVVCVVFAVLPALTALLIKQRAPDVKWDRTAPYFVLSDGRHLAYEVRGSPSSQHTAIYIHGTPSCRQESLAINERVLESVSLRLIAVDKPGYGQSDFHYGRSLRSFVDDLEEVADHLKLQRFFLIGVSGGGPYSWAYARYAPQRLQAVLIFSGAGNLGILNKAERDQFEVQTNGVHRRISHFMHSTYSTPLKSLLSYMFETKIGGRQLYSTVLKPLMRDPRRFMATRDVECVNSGHEEYMDEVIPQALLQQSATPWVQDLGLFSTEWGFNVNDTAAHLKPRIHLWHGTGDKQVSEVMSIAFKRLVPEARLQIIDDGAHFHYFVCNLDVQKEALASMISSAF